jgi:enediyne biosynthesis protein E4
MQIKIVLKILFIVLFVKNVCPQVIRFEDITLTSGIGTGGNNHSIAFGDYDNDGDLDLFIVKGNNEGNHLFQNTGDNYFLDVSYSAGIEHYGYGYHGMFGDYDNDGDLDIYVVNSNSANFLYKNNGDESFVEIGIEAGVGDKGDGRGAVFFDYNNDGYLDIYVTNNSQQSNVLFKNNRDGTFSNMSVAAEVNDSGDGSGVAAGDIDNNGDLDLYITNFREHPDILYLNNGDGTFTNISDAAGIETNYFGMCAAFADLDNDGYQDIFVTNYYNLCNKFYHNNGDGTFTESAQNFGLSETSNGRGISINDFDYDGNLDIYVANNGRNSFYLNNDFSFEDVALESNIADSGNTYGVSAGDINNDGFLDLFVVNWKSRTNSLYKNMANLNNWIIVKTQGTISNSNGIGARIEVVSGDLKQTREVTSGCGYLCQESLPVEFGLGSANRVDFIVVKWPSGIVQEIANSPINQTITLVEPRFKTDLSINQIVAPKQLIPNISVNPSVIIENCGTASTTDIDVNFKIDSSGVLIYKNSKVLEYLNNQDTLGIVFPPWTPTSNSDYQIYCDVEINNDQNPKNNSLLYPITVLYLHDIAIQDIVWPGTVTYDEIMCPDVIIENVGWSEENYFDVTCQIYNETREIVYAVTHTIINLARHESKHVYFNEWIPECHGIYTINFYSQLTTDQNKDNDTLSVKINVGNVSVPKTKEQHNSLGIFTLTQNYPNPFNPSTTIRYQLARGTHVKLEIYNFRGDKIKTLINGNQSQGFHEIKWNGGDYQDRNAASGIYFCRIVTKDYIKNIKLLLIK